MVLEVCDHYYNINLIPSNDASNVGQSQTHPYVLYDAINDFSQKFRELRHAFQTSGDVPKFISLRAPVGGHELGTYLGTAFDTIWNV